MKAAIVSDLHLGTRFFLHAEFTHFVEQLPADVALILNGDVVDHPRRPLPALHAAVLELLRHESLHRPVIWISGNHDERYALADPGRIRFEPNFSDGRRLFITHGDDFAALMPHHLAFKLVFRAIHHARILLGAESVHVAQYAKRFPVLYRVLRRRVCLDAVNYARANGYAAIACGHVHFAEDVTVGGVRYINTGCWTERPTYYLRVTDDDLALVCATPRDAVPSSMTAP